jgi:hypothetical protein
MYSLTVVVDKETLSLVWASMGGFSDYDGEVVTEERGTEGKRIEDRG